jgi:hypothetical protein
LHSFLYLYLYLYLTCTSLTEGVYTDPLYHKGGKFYGSRIAWSDVASTWSKSEISDAAATSTAVTDNDHNNDDDAADDAVLCIKY